MLCLAQIHNRKNDWSCINGMHIIADLPTIEIALARPTAAATVASEMSVICQS